MVELKKRTLTLGRGIGKKTQIERNYRVDTEKKEKIWTVQEVIRWTTQFFEKKGLPKARISAELLLSEVMESNRTYLYTVWNDAVEKERLDKFKTYVQRCVEGEPLEYIVGYKWFMTFKFEVNSFVLIPRLETEELVEWVVKGEKGIATRYLDLCTGSGVIAISLARLIPNSFILATDISEEALQVARRNASTNAVDQRLEFVRSDFLQDIESRLADIEVVVCNPPYISRAEADHVQESVLKYEPEIALFANSDGLFFYRIIAEKIKRWMGKRLYFEINPEKVDALKEMFAFAKTLEFKKDIYDRWRFMKVVVDRES